MNIDIGCNCYIDSKWIPKGLSTNLYDICNNEIKTGDKITLIGCTSKIATIGKSKEKFCIYFGSNNGSIRWFLDKETIVKHKIKVLN